VHLVLLPLPRRLRRGTYERNVSESFAARCAAGSTR
jgi:hypothetical protein